MFMFSKRSGNTSLNYLTIFPSLVGWLVVLRINVDLAIFQPYLDLEAGYNQSLKIHVARPGIKPRSSCSASQELNHSATAAPTIFPRNQQSLEYLSRYMFSKRSANASFNSHNFPKKSTESKNVFYVYVCKT